MARDVHERRATLLAPRCWRSSSARDAAARGSVIMAGLPVRFGPLAHHVPIQPVSSTPFEAHITDLGHDGRGVARIDGKTVFVSGALLGEQVLARLRKRHRHFDEAEVVE